MTTLPEITDLFARLASHLQTLNHTSPINKQEEEEEEEAIDLSISKLNQSLNLNDNSRVRVLDTALSVMCFKAPQVFDTVIEYSVKTIVSVLSASINCKVFRFQNEEFLQIGSSISCRDCVELIQVFSDVIGKLEGHGMLSNLLLHAVVRVAVSASTFRFLLPSTPILDAKSIDGKNTAVSKLLSHLPREFFLTNDEIPLRLLIWYLDPLTLKHDISKILQETMERPFLCLDKEFYERMEWRSVLLCLVVSPIMFVEMRALLHNWFLVTGLASVLEFLIELVSLILDVISRPTCWGLSVELGSEIPFSNAYFPYKCQLLQTLAGPLSSENFLHLVNGTGRPVSHARKQFDPTINPAAVKVAIIDHKSIWALAIDFPDWFYFASVLLFSEKTFQDNFQSKCTLGESGIGQTHKMESPSYAAAAARYIAWFLNPVSKSHQDLLIDCLTKLSESWTLKQFCSGTSEKETASYRKKLKKPKCHDKEDCTLAKEYDSQTIRLWLRELENIYKRYWNKAVDNSACSDGNSSHGQIVFFRRILLGILIGCSSHINEAGCELLLHYAATGRILQSRETKGARLKHVKLSSDEQEDSVALVDECNKEEAVAGTCIVFRLTDIVESMSTSMFETEENELDFVFRAKVRAGKYLVKCIKRLIQLKIEENGVFMLMDLYSRLLRWRHRGGEVLQVQKDLDDVISGLSHKLSSL